MDCRLNSVRVDYKPHIRTSDLDLAKARKLFNIGEKSVIKRQFFTVKFTSSLCLQIWFKGNINTTSVRCHLSDIFKIYTRLNNIKPTRVCKLTTRGIINLQASGSFHKKIDFSLITKHNLPIRYKLLGTSALTEPFTPIESAHTARYIQITCNHSSHLRICFSGNFTIIARSVLDYKELLKIAQTLSVCHLQDAVV